MIKKFFSSFYYKHLHYSAFFYHLRHYLHESEIAGLKPFSKDSVISDLFVYRQDSKWETSFRLFNISSLLFPEAQIQEKCEIHFFGKKGKFIKKVDFFLDPFALKTINLAHIGDLEYTGTFAVFHHSDVVSKIREKGSCLTERGYIAYKYKGSPLSSYCHGNLQSLSKGSSSKITSVAAVSKQKTSYYPQMIFSDCNGFELIFTNPTNKRKRVGVEMMNDKNHIMNTVDADIEPYGVEILSFDNKEKHIHTIKTYGQIMMWRPLVKKFYSTHFDVLHA